ncbi:phospholipase D-like domain-containing protein [Clostridium sp. Ade.TY]|uniref:phospholipase D-like domain-containing protein n=1 Tax=Clostridium sp. Ade.TY TaxID=1391647 RepID=UPI00040364F9|nr:phospholipase D-like domain-containing protein [Clostridium sp. Ade.TY]
MGIIKWTKSKLLNKEERRKLEKNEKILEENIKLKKEKILILKEAKEIGERLRTLEKINKDQEKKLNENIAIDFFDDEIENLIIKNICKAKNELCIAVGWFTSDKIIAELEKLKDSGIKIRIIVDDNEYNLNKMNNLTKVSNQLKFVNLGNKNHMHHKYCIIDDLKVINGSYNWTNNARNSLENITIIKSRKIVKKFKKNFEGIIKKY